MIRTQTSITAIASITLLHGACSTTSATKEDGNAAETGADSTDAGSRWETGRDGWASVPDGGWKDGSPGDGSSYAGDAGDGPPVAACGPGTAPLRRLTAVQYRLAIADLTGLGALAVQLPADGSQDGFEGFAALQSVSAVQVETYHAAAQEVAAYFGANLGRLLPCDPQATPEEMCVGRLLDTFGKSAFRRPLDAEERTRYAGLFTTLRMGETFRGAIEQTVRALLSSPHFLYRPELGRARPAAGMAWVPLTDHEVATRLSFLLWGRGPDAALLALADKGGLTSARDVADQARRMLSDPRARPGMGNLFRQWLELDQVARLQKDTAAFPQLTPTLRAAVAREPALFVDHVLFGAGGTVKELLGAPYTFVNAELAGLYGVSAPGGSSWAKTALDPKQRGGLLTQPWFLASHATATRTSPTRRGVFILERLLCQDVSAPPANAPALDKIPPPNSTLREQLESLTAASTCRTCHAPIDALGFPFESFDALGALRTTDNGRPVDPSSRINGTRDIDGQVGSAADLVAKLASSGQVLSCFARRFYEASAGRAATPEDRCRLEEMGSGLTASGGNLLAWLPNLTARQEFIARPSAGLAPAPVMMLQVAPAAATSAATLATKVVLDVVRSDLTSLAARFVGADASKIQQHLEVLRDLERRLVGI